MQAMELEAGVGGGHEVLPRRVIGRGPVRQPREAARVRLGPQRVESGHHGTRR
jgi:hypothetical protein